MTSPNSARRLPRQRGAVFSICSGRCALGFWWTLQRAGGLRGKAQHWLLLCAAIMAACPIISTSRGGALVSAGIMAATLGYLGWTSWRSFVQGRPGEGQGTSGWLFFFLTAALVLGWFWGWKSLAPRMEQIGGGYQYREAIYADALADGGGLSRVWHRAGDLCDRVPACIVFRSPPTGRSNCTMTGWRPASRLAGLVSACCWRRWRAWGWLHFRPGGMGSAAWWCWPGWRWRGA